MKQGEIKLKSTDGLDLFGRYWAPEGKVVAVVGLVHGHGEHGGRYSHLAQQFTDAGIAVVAMDLRGHGKSGGNRGHVPDYAFFMADMDQLLAKARELFPDAPQFLYGHSMGGNIVANYLLREKPAIQGAIISAPWLRLAFPDPAIKVFLGKIMYKLWPGLTLPTGLNTKHLSRDTEVVKAYENDPLVHAKISARLGISAMLAGEWAIENADRLTIPVLVMHGEGDQITSHKASDEFVQKAGKLATFKLWPELYHEIHNENNKKDVIQTGIDWITGQLKK